MRSAALEQITYQPGQHSTEQSAQVINFVAALRARGHEVAPNRPRLVLGDGRELELPDELMTIMEFVAENLAAHRGITVAPVDQQLTTQEAADFLGISRPTLIKRLDAGEVPHTMAGRHRRIALRDLIAYRDRQVATRAAALQEMADIARESGLYDATAGINPEGIR